MSIKPSRIREMSPEARRKLLIELKTELMRLKALQESRGVLDNPSRIRILRKNIARVLTIEREEELKKSKKNVKGKK
ncbi:MAG: 50S ribosomal protein L29 [Thermoprotei archaeon]|nr:MAG: 50S ribosomal protein L29 [Thermoprotei archaeon]RLF01073.1 MAG: 50S ribosomal protein L29 [Thermoprotei archaeon]